MFAKKNLVRVRVRVRCCVGDIESGRGYCVEDIVLVGVRVMVGLIFAIAFWLG